MTKENFFIADDQPMKPEPHEVEDFFDAFCRRRRPDGKRMNQREIAKELGVSQSTISRNRKGGRRRKKGLGLSDDMYESAERKLIDERLQEQKSLQERHEVQLADDDRRPVEHEVTVERIKEPSPADQAWEHRVELAREADYKRRQGVIEMLEPYWQTHRQQGIRQEGDTRLHGDAAELVETAKPEEIVYTDAGCAVVALAPDWHRFPCGRTAAQLRDGISAQERLLGKYPFEIRRRMIPDAELRPDARACYPLDYAELLDWQRMNHQFRPLAENRWPLMVSLSDADAFRDFVELHKKLCGRMYKLQGSCLDVDDVETQLRKINVATMPMIALDGIMTGLNRATFGTIVASVFSKLLLGWV